ncbi:leucine-rich repeats and immunoglobulin-like domains protein 2 [Notothenia coriiceps]|uniref:leucine-rich repeats and immunoglobulin-like domains protein 2 n=1 Tax=Notothenia coriiceps TaxID=8208 RepID=UPI00054DF387|nr:PREDICTED: leucine-rich repeats and immunoglobulin-like domains protein 2 [Notothenia coriiceps]
MAEGWPIPSALVFVLLSLSAWALESCPAPCSCLKGQDEVYILDCNRKRLSAAPVDPPEGIIQVTMNHNELTVLPFLGDVSSNITSLSLVHNRISALSMYQLQPYVSLETLDLTSNSITELNVGSFPSMQLKYLNLSNNRISVLEPGCFENISSSLLVLKLNRNRLAMLPSKVFKLPLLQFLELKRNKIKIVDSLTFKGMDSLKSLKMQRNSITKLMDGAFFGLNNIEELELEHNNLTEVNKGWLYGLRMLRILRVSQNTVGIIRPDAWEFCQKLEELDLSFNHLTRLEETAFVGLGLLDSLNLGENSISHLGEGVFSGLTSLRTLDIRNNEISWAIEDSIGVFVGMKKLNSLIIQRNKIKSITKKAFEGLDELEHLDLSKNGIMSIHPEAMSHMKLKEFVLNTSSLLCDCHMQWLGPWLTENSFLQSVSAVCAHPASLLAHNVLSVGPQEFVCDDFPKPRITTHPETYEALRGNNVTLSCVASSSSDSPMTTAWRKDGEVLYDAEVQNYARYQEGELIYTAVLHLLNANFTDEGRYQCVVSNHFGSNYSNRAKLTVNGVCYGDTGSEVETEGSGMLHCRVGSLFTGRSSFHPGEPREGLAGHPAGGAGPLVICSDCYDNANIYSRTREYCPYAYLGEDDPLDKSIPGLKESFGEHTQHDATPLDSLISNHNSSIFLTPHDKRLSSHTPPEHYANDSLSRSFWGEGEDPSLRAPPGASPHPVTVHRTPHLAADGPEEQREAESDCFPRQSTQDHRSASNRTNPQEHTAPS